MNKEVKEVLLPEVEEKLKDFTEKCDFFWVRQVKKIKVPELLVPHHILEEYQRKAKTTIGNTVQFSLRDEKDKDYWTGFELLNCVPKKFWEENTFDTNCLDKHFYYHFNGEFYQFGYKERPNNVKLWDLTWLKDKPDVPNDKIVDFSSYSNVASAMDQVSLFLTMAVETLNTYSTELEYHPNKYEKIVQVDKVVPDKDLYDPDLSVSREDSERVNKWMKKHDEKYHPKGLGYQGCTPVSNFEMRKGWTGLGAWCDMVCTCCLDRAKELEEAGKKDEAEKLKKDATFEIEEIG